VSRPPDLLRPRPASPGRVVVVGVAAPVLATLAAVPLNRTGLGSAISIYLLAVVMASLLGGLRGGLLAAGLSSLAFTFFFTEPRNTLRIQHPEDVAAAVGLLVAAVLVGLVLSSALDERRRAEQREREARLLAYLSTRLLSGESLQRVLDDFVTALLEPFHLARCDLVAVAGDREVRASAVAAAGDPSGPSEVVPLELGGSAFGELTAVRGLGAGAMDREERALLETFARQAAVALERDRLASRMRDAQLDAETNQLRAALFSSVTHDLRTPLASIKAGVTSLLDTGVTHDADQQHELLTTVLEETDRLNRLVGNIMDLARIRAGALVPSRETIALDEVAASVLARMRPRFDEGHVTIRTVFRPAVPDVAVDPLQVDQVFTNVLENALRYAPRGSEVQVSVATFRDVVRVRVVDQGPGIPAADRERVFEAFVRGDRAGDRPGSGLGLAIAQAIVVAHGGWIWIEDAPGSGAALSFDLPVSVPADVTAGDSR
jgi:two-component system, OmpR family, sensor histidine kinase KdpD